MIAGRVTDSSHWNLHFLNVAKSEHLIIIWSALACIKHWCLAYNKGVQCVGRSKVSSITTEVLFPVKGYLMPLKESLPPPDAPLFSKALNGFCVPSCYVWITCIIFQKLILRQREIANQRCPFSRMWQCTPSSVVRKYPTTYIIIKNCKLFFLHGLSAMLTCMLPFV